MADRDHDEGDHAREHDQEGDPDHDPDQGDHAQEHDHEGDPEHDHDQGDHAREHDQEGDRDRDHDQGDHAREHDHGDSHAHGDHEGEHDHGHDHHAHDVETLGFGVITVSSTRAIQDDPAGDAIVAAVDGAGHDLATRELVGDDYDRIQGAVDALVNRRDVDVVVTTGGTGVTPDDLTVEAVEPLLEKDLPGFGELFRRLSYDEIGTRVVGTRTTGGVTDGVAVFCLPGSENAARLGIEEIVLPEAGHLVGLATRE